MLDLSDETTIRYLVLKVDNDEGEVADSNSNASMEDLAGDGESDDDSSDSDGIDDELQQAVLDMANKTDDSGFWSSFDENPKIKVLSGAGTCWTGMTPRYSLGVLAGSSSFLSSSHPATQSEKATGASFDEYIQHATGQTNLGELMGGQALLKDVPPQVNWWNCVSWLMTRLILHAVSTPSSLTRCSLSSKRCRQHSWAQVVSLRSSSMTWPQLA